MEEFRAAVAGDRAVVTSAGLLPRSIDTGTTCSASPDGLALRIS